jgi:hypothetical protein
MRQEYYISRQKAVYLAIILFYIYACYSISLSENVDKTQMNSMSCKVEPWHVEQSFSFLALPAAHGSLNYGILIANKDLE